MTEPSDTDRIIAAHREEAQRTRRTIVGVLVGIFVGIPAAGLIIWGIVVATHTGSPASGTGTDTTIACVSTPPTDALDPGATGPACPLSGAALTEDSLCSAFNAAQSQTTPDGRTNPSIAFMEQASITNTVPFETECAFHPSETLGAAVRHVETQPAG